MEPGEIEFVHPVEPAPDGAPTRQPRRRYALAQFVLVLLLAGGGIAWAVTRSHGHGYDPVAAPTGLVHPSALPEPGVLTVLPSIHGPLPLPGVSISVSCAIQADCAQSGAASDHTIAQALTQYLPKAALTSIATTIGREHGANPVLSERIIDAHLDSVDLLLRVRPYLRPEPDPTVGISPTPPGLGSALFRFETASYVVDVQWTGTDATPPPVTALESLADDPRLESLG